MKYSIFICIALFIAACSKTGNTLNEPTSSLPMLDTLSTNLIWRGDFENGFYGSCTGKVFIYKVGDTLKLRLDDFRVSNGPDLKVYISKEAEPLNFYSLGSLQAFSGNQEYKIMQRIDFNAFKYVIIHCERYNHQFGKSVLRMP
ncbi:MULTISPECIES: DM13 domain-containing protein [unclassified Paraflavitalea]|uniref:DM13 domain-containing protein n=1 Tax=unclassified Paraflavitalea TaxID=2798305 RepID=UPI003D352A36